MSDKHYAILKAEKLNRKHIHEIKKRCEHVNRVDYAANVNKNLSVHNECVIGQTGADWFQLFIERFDNLEYYKLPSVPKLRKDAVIGIEAVVSLSHDFVSQVDIDEWVAANNKWIQKYFGKENVLHGTLHMDEMTPHIHYFITPIKDGHFNASQIMGDKKKYRERQTDYSKAMQPFGLQRGLKHGGRMNYESMPALYQKTGQVIDAPIIIEHETVEDYRERINKKYRNFQIRNKKLELDIERLDLVREYAHELEDKVDELQKSLDNMTIGDIPVKNIIAAVENYQEHDIIATYMDGFQQLADVGEFYLNPQKQEHDEQEQDSIEDI